MMMMLTVSPFFLLALLTGPTEAKKTSPTSAAAGAVDDHHHPEPYQTRTTTTTTTTDPPQQHAAVVAVVDAGRALQASATTPAAAYRARYVGRFHDFRSPDCFSGKIALQVACAGTFTLNRTSHPTIVCTDSAAAANTQLDEVVSANAVPTDASAPVPLPRAPPVTRPTASWTLSRKATTWAGPFTTNAVVIRSPTSPAGFCLNQPPGRVAMPPPPPPAPPTTTTTATTRWIRCTGTFCKRVWRAKLIRAGRRSTFMIHTTLNAGLATWPAWNWV
jgi:hypothetical protein